jgi:hypothetical protein
MNSQQKLVLITVVVLVGAFVVLSPGVVLNLPPHKNRFKTRNIFFTGETHISSVLVHALVFSVAAYFLITKYTLAPVVSVVSNLSKPVKSIAPTVNLLATTVPSN